MRQHPGYTTGRSERLPMGKEQEAP